MGSWEKHEAWTRVGENKKNTNALHLAAVNLIVLYMELSY